MFNDLIIEDIKTHAQICYPRESCGIVAGGEYFGITNTHREPGKHFRIDPKILVHYRNRFERIDGIMHSHPNGPDFPSYEDQLAQRDTATAWGIVVVREGFAEDPFFFGDEAPVPPLIGRTFRHGVTDCYALVRDWFRTEMDVLLPNFPRKNKWWEDENMFLDHFQEAGFERIERIEKRGDCVIGSILSKVPNHTGVYEGDGLLLHHLCNRLSRREPIGPWIKHVDYHLRYVGK